MEEVFSVEDISDCFWAASPTCPGLLPPGATDGGPRGSLNRSPSEWYFEKFLEVAEQAAVPSTTSPIPPNPSPDPNSNPYRNPSPSPVSVVASNCCDGGRGEDDEVVQIKAPAVVAAAAAVLPQGPPSDPPADVGPEEYALLLKERLDMCCAAVAMSRSSGVNPQDSSLLTDIKSQSLDASELGSQAPAKGNSSKVQQKAGSGPSGGPAPTIMQNLGVQGRPSTSGSSGEQSDDEELEGEMETTGNPADAKRMRRMKSNRESARRSRRRKQAHMNGLEAQVSQLRLENSSLLKRFTDINQKYNEAAVDNRILKADVETLRAKVKMAEDSVKRVTGVSPIYPNISDISTIGMPFNGSPPDATSDVAVHIQDDPNHFFQPSPHDQRINTCLPEIASAPPVENAMHGAVAGEKIGLEHLHRSWDAAARDPETSVNSKQNQSFGSQVMTARYSLTMADGRFYSSQRSSFI